MTPAANCYSLTPVFLILGLLLAAFFLIGSQTREAGAPYAVEITGPLGAAERAELLQLIQQETRDRWTLQKLRRRLTAPGWVADAKLRYLAGGRLEVQVFPELPVARWNQAGYLNSAGQVFQSAHPAPPGLPSLFGPENSLAEVMSRYREVTRALAPVNQEIQRLQRDAGGSWSFVTRSGMEVQLGDEDIQLRLDHYRLVLMYLAENSERGLPSGVDTRYGNGAAVTWRARPAVELAADIGW